MKTRCYTLAAACVLVAVPATAGAHILGTEHGFAAGMLHPLTGADHLITLLAAGFWAQRLGGTARVSIPLALLVALFGGALLAMLGAQWSLIEPVVWSSMLVMAWLAVRGIAIRAVAGCALALAVGILHGYAHATGLPLDGGSEWFVAGMLATSAALLRAGAALAVRLVPQTRMAVSGDPDSQGQRRKRRRSHVARLHLQETGPLRCDATSGNVSIRTCSSEFPSRF